MDSEYSDIISKIFYYELERPLREDMQSNSYAEWAIEEILERLIEASDIYNHRWVSPKDVVEDFYEDMEYHEDISDTERQKKIFRIAKEETDQILACMF